MKVGDKVRVTDVMGFVDEGTIVAHEENASGYQDFYFPGTARKDFMILVDGEARPSSLFWDDKVEVVG